MKYFSPFYLSSLLVSMFLSAGTQAAMLADFEGASPLSGWDNNNNWNVISDPADAGNNVLNTSDRGGNFLTGVSLDSPVPGSTTFAFDFRLTTSTNADISIFLSDVGSYNGLGSTDTTVFGPTIRLVDDEIQVHDGGFTSVTQSVSINTWYTVTMEIDNTADSWSGTLLGGSYLTETPLSHSAGDTDFAFRNSMGTLQSVGFRANTQNNNNSGGALIDNMVIIPEPSSLLLLTAALGTLCYFQRRRR